MQLFFSIIWVAFCLFMMIMLYKSSGILGMIFTGPFLGLFLSVGVVLLVISIKKIIRDKKTDKHGMITYGLVSGLKPTGAKYGGREELKAEVIIVDDIYNLSRYEEVVGSSYNKYPVGTFVKVKYFEGDINIISAVGQNEVPWDVGDRLIAEFKNSTGESYVAMSPSSAELGNTYIDKPETIVINGVEYVRSEDD